MANYMYTEGASDDMLIRLLLTLDGRGVEEKRQALAAILESMSCCQDDDGRRELLEKVKNFK